MIESLLLTAARVCTFEQQRFLTNASSFFFERDLRRTNRRRLCSRAEQIEPEGKSIAVWHGKVVNRHSDFLSSKGFQPLLEQRAVVNRQQLL